jgi:tRNA pseudouridine38-40 synthase
MRRGAVAGGARRRLRGGRLLGDTGLRRGRGRRNRGRTARRKTTQDEDAATSGPYGVLLTVAYEGAEFHGFVKQEGLRTVADTLLGAVRALDESITTLSGVSRTDAGVHAEAQMVAFDANRRIEPRGWVLGTNRHLPDDVAVRAARIVPAGFVPRFASVKKRYRYRLLRDRVRDPFHRVRAWRIDGDLDLELLRREAASIEGTHDFRAFRSAKDERENTTRTMFEVSVEERTPRILEIAITGTAFMHNMVRILVGTLVDVGLGRKPGGAIAAALSSGERADAGMTAPSHGLTLEHVELRLPEGSNETWPP